jgi:hypothetical protein
MARTRTEMSTATKRLLKLLRPLTATEQRNATAAAVKHLSGELSQRYRVFPAELRIEKPPQPDAAPERTTAVVIVDYERRRTTEVLVGARARPVRQTDLTGFQPAYLADEIREARELAERDESVASAIRVRGLFVSAFGPPAYEERGARLIGLRYAAGDARQGVRLLSEVVVDLSRQELVTVEVMQGEGGQ